jgi:hypothetical protein
MDEEVAGLIRVYLSLTSGQRAAFVDNLNEYIRGSQYEKDRITRESVFKGTQRMDVGPAGGACPYCGR